MEDKIVIIRVAKDGTCTFDAKGFHGSECVSKTEQIMRALGQVVSAEMKPEYNEIAMTNEFINQGV